MTVKLPIIILIYNLAGTDLIQVNTRNTSLEGRDLQDYNDVCGIVTSCILHNIGQFNCNYLYNYIYNGYNYVNV